MKRARTAVDAANVGGSEAVDGREEAETTATGRVICSVDTEEQLRATLRQKDKELLCKDEELQAMQANFAELDACSRELEQELESEIFRLSRMNRELESTNRNLERRLENELCRNTPAQIKLSAHNDEVAKLRQTIQCLEQENDDFHMCIRRLETTEEDLRYQLDCAQEVTVFVQQELESLQEHFKEATSQSRDQIRELTSEVMKYRTFKNFVWQVGKLQLELDAECVDETVEEQHEPNYLSSIKKKAIGMMKNRGDEKLVQQVRAGNQIE
ncbi:unnamed protein product [Phytophthora lilii]|uniref:Unnamed protein product n=1 Tax=Phytophthora lilii TaxID=2077276 RepID=A0A9W6TI44_9STRA|nr:unnamed protein product [Phytophthora lilii]